MTQPQYNHIPVQSYVRSILPQLPPPPAPFPNVSAVLFLQSISQLCATVSTSLHLGCVQVCMPVPPPSPPDIPAALFAVHIPALCHSQHQPAILHLSCVQVCVPGQHCVCPRCPCLTLSTVLHKLSVASLALGLCAYHDSAAVCAVTHNRLTR